jgi:hypothetical protein
MRPCPSLAADLDHAGVDWRFPIGDHFDHEPVISPARSGPACSVASLGPGHRGGGGAAR